MCGSSVRPIKRLNTAVKASLRPFPGVPNSVQCGAADLLVVLEAVCVALVRISLLCGTSKCALVAWRINTASFPPDLWKLWGGGALKNWGSFPKFLSKVCCVWEPKQACLRWKKSELFPSLSGPERFGCSLGSRNLEWRLLVEESAKFLLIPSVAPNDFWRAVRIYLSTAEYFVFLLLVASDLFPSLDLLLGAAQFTFSAVCVTDTIYFYTKLIYVLIKLHYGKSHNWL